MYRRYEPATDRIAALQTGQYRRGPAPATTEIFAAKINGDLCTILGQISHFTAVAVQQLRIVAPAEFAISKLVVYLRACLAA
jgi:hypothetical protein